METLAPVKTDQNISVIQQAFTDFLNGNIPAIIDVCTDDIVWTTFETPEVPYARTYNGKQGVGLFFSTLAANVDYTQFEPREFYADGDKIFVKGYHAATVKSTGKSYGQEFLMEFNMRDAKVAYFRTWLNINDQIKAFSN
jgi:uncharacterized protein